MSRPPARSLSRRPVAPPRPPRWRAAALVVLLWALGPATAAVAATPPDPGVPGPFAVGHDRFTIVDPTREDAYPSGTVDRTFSVEVWYPVRPNDHAGPLAFYDFQLLGLGFSSERARDGAPVAPGTAFPLVVFSHGSSGINVQSTKLCETLASHGFVVAAPSHSGNTAIDVFFARSFPFDVNARNRPLDVSLVIDHMIDRGRTPGDPLEGAVNPHQIGATGHSFGGFTALAMAAGYDDGGVDPDPRVRAVAPIAPASRPFATNELESITVPLFVLAGTLDTTTPIVPNSTLPYTLASSRRVYRADIEGATHSAFAEVCKLADVLFGFNAPIEFVRQFVPNFDETCDPAALPIADAERIQNLYLVSFFRRHLAIDSRYEQFLRPEYAEQELPIVSYFRRATRFASFYELWLSLLGLQPADG